MKVLSLSSVYPNPAEPGLGLFVRSRLQALAEQAEVQVIAPIPVLDYSHPGRKIVRRREFAESRQDGHLRVFHPRWLFPPFGTPLNILCEFARLVPLVANLRRSFAFDVIDAHFCYPDGCAAALLSQLFRTPFTITLRGSELAFDRHYGRRLAMRAALRQASAVMAVSDELRDFAIARGASPERTRTVPNGIDADLFHRRDAISMRRRHGLPMNRALILSAGELIEAKGHHLVTRALEAVLAQGHDVELLIAGATARGGPQFESKLREYVRDAGLTDRVRFLGWVDRQAMAELLCAVDLFCLASRTEGWPNVVNEALACGAPVVVSRVGGVSAMVASPEFGTIVPQNDMEALESAIGAALNRRWDRDAISAWGRSRCWERVASEVLEIFEDTMRVYRGPAKELPKAAAGSL